MKTDIFENVKFGDKFATRDGRLAIYWKENATSHVLILENGDLDYCPKELQDGHVESEDEIVGRWEPKIDEKLLDQMAESYADYYALAWESDSYGYYGSSDGFKEGYRRRARTE